MVAVFIKIGDSLMHNELGLRLLTVISNPIALWLLWLCLKPYGVQARWFIVLVSGIFIIHMYGFTTTPDSPLLLFTALFYFVYQKYIVKDSWPLALLLAVIIAGLLYSKYHGILLVGFTLLANVKLLRRPSFWLIVVLAAALFSPHVYWQFANGFPSLKYHLVDRSSAYDVAYTLNYIPGQLAMGGPLIGWFLFYRLFKTRITDVFIRTLLLNAAGTFLFFLLSTVKGNVEIHWTLIAFVPLLLVVLIGFTQTAYPARWLWQLAIVNALLIVLLRIALMLGLPFVKQVGQLKSYFGYREWTRLVHQRAGGGYVVIRDGFQDPAKYNYYTNSIRAISYDSRYYRRTQFDMWPIEDSINNHRVLYMVENPEKPITTDSLVIPPGWRYYTGYIDSVRLYQKLEVELQQPLPAKIRQGEPLHLAVNLRNHLKQPLRFNNLSASRQVFLTLCYFKGTDLIFTQHAPASFNQVVVPPNGVAAYQFTLPVQAPPGRYQVMLSVQAQPLCGAHNSGTTNVEVE